MKENEKNIYQSYAVHYLEDLPINIGNKNVPRLFFDILYYGTIIYEDSALGFRLGAKECFLWFETEKLCT